MREILGLCSAMPERAIPAGESILREGDRTGVLFILIEGAVEVLKGDVQVNKIGRASCRERVYVLV